MNEDAMTIIEQPSFEDPVAARGEAVLRMCLAAKQVRDREVKAALLRGVEKVIASIPVAPGNQATVSTVPGSKHRL